MIKSEIKFERKPVFGDMMLAIAEKENCGNYNINIDYDYIYYKNNEPFIIKYEIYEKEDLREEVKEIIKECGIINYKMNGKNTILFNNDKYELCKQPHTDTYIFVDGCKIKQYKRKVNMVKYLNSLNFDK